MPKKEKKDKTLTAKVKDLAEELLCLMGTSAKVDVSEDKENEAVVVNIQTESERGLLIGHHGETLNAIQAALGMILRRETGEWVRVIVNIGDWRERQEEQLKKLALEVAERAKQTGEPQPLYNLTPAQRRVIHLELSGDEQITTESTGEGTERYLVVKPKR
jgi:spoIIIJ-associated protein